MRALTFKIWLLRGLAVWHAAAAMIAIFFYSARFPGFFILLPLWFSLVSLLCNKVANHLVQHRALLRQALTIVPTQYAICPEYKNSKRTACEAATKVFKQ